MSVITKPVSVGRTCQKCKYFNPYFDQHNHVKLGYGVCRYNPPQIVGGDHGTNGYWPDVYNNDWCGHHVEKLGE